jgi:hypothetical protein
MNGMAIRLIAAAIAVATFLIAGFFVVIAVRGPADGVMARDSPTARNFAPSSTTTHRIGRFTVTAITIVRSDEAEIALSISDERGNTVVSQNVPSAILQMSGMESIPVGLRKTSSGLWHGSGRPSMSGRWAFIVTIDGEQVLAPIDIP